MWRRRHRIWQGAFPDSLSAMIPPDLLIDFGRPSRRPLRDWADRVLGALPPFARQPEEWGQLAACMNLAALIDVYRGNRDGATGLCELQLQWVWKLQRSDGALAALVFAFQSWINLGRLLRIEGDLHGALDRFAIFIAQRAERELRMGPVVIDAQAWQALLAFKPLLSADLETLYVVETLKALLPDPERTLQFIAWCRAEGVRGDLPYLAEAEMIALARAGRYDDALATTKPEAFRPDSYAAMVARAHRAAVLAISGDSRRAREGVEEIFALMPALDPARISDQTFLRYNHQVGTVARHLGMNDAAHRAFTQGLAGARGFGDEPLELLSMEALLALGGGPDRESLQQAREELLRGCLNVTVLRPRGLAAAPKPACDPIFGDLRQALIERTRQPLPAGAPAVSPRPPKGPPR